MEQIRAVPGVVSVGTTTKVPLATKVNPTIALGAE
jgi:hypothetical protein